MYSGSHQVLLYNNFDIYPILPEMPQVLSEEHGKLVVETQPIPSLRFVFHASPPLILGYLQFSCQYLFCCHLLRVWVFINLLLWNNTRRYRYKSEAGRANITGAGDKPWPAVKVSSFSKMAECLEQGCPAYSDWGPLN